MSISLDQKVAIVTGSGAGLGAAYAKALAAAGAAVVVNAVSEAAYLVRSNIPCLDESS